MFQYVVEVQKCNTYESITGLEWALCFDNECIVGEEYKHALGSEVEEEAVPPKSQEPVAWPFLWK